MTERLARASSRRPWLVVGLWMTVILAAFVTVAMFLAFEGEAERIERGPLPFHLDQHAVRRVPAPATELPVARQPVDEGPEPHALHGAAHGQPQALSHDASRPR